jgi:hypothetical protein
MIGVAGYSTILRAAASAVTVLLLLRLLPRMGCPIAERAAA